MQPALIEALTTGAAAGELATIEPAELADPLRLQQRLRRRFSPEVAAAIAETARLRRRALEKFPSAERMLFTDAGLQQATAAVVARHRSDRFRGARSIIDLGTGIGGDAMALIDHAPVVGVDLQRSLLTIARHNVADPRFHPVRADARTLPAVPGAHVFADPARRRADGRRIFDPERYSPPLSMVVDRWITAAEGGAVKVAPGIADTDVPTGAEAEFVSLAGQLRECTLWFGSTRTGAERVATLLPDGHRLARSGPEAPLEIRPVGEWIHEPDPAVIRASLIGDLAGELGLGGIDPTIAYLTGDARLASPFLTSYRVESWMPFNLKRLKAHLRSLGAGDIVVKKRGSAVDPEELRRRLRVPGSERRVVVVTRAGGRQIAVVVLPG